MRRLDADDPQDFWSAVLRRFHVSKVAFSRHLPDDRYFYVLEALPMVGEPRTLIIPEKYRREFPPLPSILDLTHTAGRFSDPTHRAIYLGQDALYGVDRDGMHRVSEPLDFKLRADDA
jgi:hypothetical protein